MNALTADQLRLVALIGRLGSLSAAADSLGLTPAAVTQRLARMEAAVGATLVVRGPRGATLTTTGALLGARGERIDAETVRADDDLRTWLDRRGHRLRVGAFQAAALHLLPPALTALRHVDQTTDISVVDIQSDEGAALVVDGTLDLAVIAAWDEAPDLPSALQSTLLTTDPMVVVVPDDHRLARARGPIRLADLADESWVVIRAGHQARAQLDRAARAAGFVPRVRFETESYDVAQALVATGYGVALVSELALTHVDGTVHRRLRGEQLHRSLYALHPVDRGVAARTAEFLGLLVQVATDLGT